MKAKMKMITTRPPAGNISSINPFLHRRSALFNSVAANDATLHMPTKNKPNNLETLIQTRCRSGTLGLDEALGYFNTMIQMKPVPSIWSFNVLIGALSKMKHYSTVVSMYKQLLVMGCAQFHPDVCTMTVVINCLSLLNRVDLGFSVSAVTLKLGLQPNTYTLTALLHGLCNYRDRNNLDEARAFSRGVGACQWGEVTRLFDEMVGHGVLPDALTLTVLFDALCHEQMKEEAHKVIEVTVHYGMKISMISCSTLVNGYCLRGKIDKAMKVFNFMVVNGHAPDIASFKSLLNGYIKSKRIGDSLRLVKEMIQRGLMPDLEMRKTMRRFRSKRHVASAE